MRTVVERALTDERGFGGRVSLAQDALEHLVASAAAMRGPRSTCSRRRSAISEVDGVDSPSLEAIETAAQQRILAYDRAGDGHYGTVSAFIKSMRGNDPDAALYWLATMVAAGEDPQVHRPAHIIVASEDVGNADPRRSQVAVAAAQALDWVGLPEAQYALAQATAYVAAAPKSNRAGQAYWAAMADVLEHGSLPVPNAPAQRTGEPRCERTASAWATLPARLRGGRRRAAVPARRARRAALLRARRPGLEPRIGERLDRLRSEREAAGVKGGRKRSKADVPSVDPMRTAGGVMKARQAGKLRPAEKQK